MTGRILLVATSGIGDTVSLLPAVRFLRAGIPSSPIDLVTTCPEVAFLFEGHLSRVIALDPGWMSSPGRLLAAFAATAAAILRAGPYAAAVVTFPSGHRATAALAIASGAPVRIGFPYPEGAPVRSDWGLTRPVACDREGIAARNLALAEALAGSPAPAAPAVSVALPEGGALPECPPVFVALAPGGGANETFKRWPAASFAALGRRLAEDGMPVVLVGGPGEEELCARVVSAIGAGAMDLSGRLTLAATARVLARARLLVANDSGLAHVAAAVGTPVVAVFGPTSDARYAPAGSGPVRVVASDLPCRPCHVAPRKEPFACRFERERACLDELDPEAVLAAARALLASGRPA